MAAQASVCVQLRALLRPEPDLCLVAESSVGPQAVGLLRRYHPEVLLLDSALGDTIKNGIMRSCVARIILIVPSIDSAHIVDALRLGALGIVLDTLPQQLLLTTVRSVAAGRYAFSDDTVAIIVDLLRQSLENCALSASESRGLTARELDVVASVAAGNRNRQIARMLSVSERTVKHHLTAIFAKLQVSSRLELATFALKNHLSAPAISREAEPRGSDRETGRSCYSTGV